MIQQIDEARIAFHELDNQGNDALQDFLQAHFPYHEAADLLKQAQLLLGTLETHLKLEVVEELRFRSGALGQTLVPKR